MRASTPAKVGSAARDRGCCCCCSSSPTWRGAWEASTPTRSRTRTSSPTTSSAPRLQGGLPGLRLGDFGASVAGKLSRALGGKFSQPACIATPGFCQDPMPDTIEEAMEEDVVALAVIVVLLLTNKRAPPANAAGDSASSSSDSTSSSDTAGSWDLVEEKGTTALLRSDCRAVFWDQPWFSGPFLDLVKRSLSGDARTTAGEWVACVGRILQRASREVGPAALALAERSRAEFRLSARAVSGAAEQLRRLQEVSEQPAQQGPDAACRLVQDKLLNKGLKRPEVIRERMVSACATLGGSQLSATTVAALRSWFGFVGRPVGQLAGGSQEGGSVTRATLWEDLNQMRREAEAVEATSCIAEGEMDLQASLQEYRERMLQQRNAAQPPALEQPRGDDDNAGTGGGLSAIHQWMEQDSDEGVAAAAGVVAVGQPGDACEAEPGAAAAAAAAFRHRLQELGVVSDDAEDDWGSLGSAAGSAGGLLDSDDGGVEQEQGGGAADVMSADEPLETPAVAAAAAEVAAAAAPVEWQRDSEGAAARFWDEMGREYGGCAV